MINASGVKVSINEPHKSLKQSATQQQFESFLGQPSPKKADPKSLRTGGGILKASSTKSSSFNFNRPSSTVNFNSYDYNNTVSRAPINFKIFNLSKSGFSGYSKGFKIPNFVYIFIQK
jgi:hypothetical protein